MDIDSASDDRTANNSVRHQYRILSDAEKADMVEIKDLGAALIAKIHAVYADKLAGSATGKAHAGAREFGQAIIRAEEAVMWAVKGLTGPIP